MVNTSVIVEHDCEIGDFVHIATGAVLSGGVKVNNNSFDRFWCNNIALQRN